jgi:hypothetical protein
MTTTLPSAATLETPLKKKKVSSVRHTRAIQRDRSKRPTVAPPDDQVAERLTEIVHPATLAQLDYYRHLGLRERLLTLPVPEIAWAQAHYPQVWVVDGSTLDALVRKVGLLREARVNPLAGRMMALLELGSRLPRQLWYTPDPDTHDQGFWPEILAALQAGALLIFDLGYTNFHVFTQLTTADVTFITRAKRNLAYQVIQTFRQTAQVHDRLVWIGKDDTRQQVRLLEVLYRGTWYRYLTNELDPLVLPTEYVVALYWQRWRIEDAYALVKRLLGLAYFWTGSANGVCLQLWAT